MNSTKTNVQGCKPNRLNVPKTSWNTRNNYFSKNSNSQNKKSCNDFVKRDWKDKKSRGKESKSWRKENKTDKLISDWLYSDHRTLKKYHKFIFLNSYENHPLPSTLLVQSQPSPSFYLKLIIYTHSSEGTCCVVKLVIYFGVFWLDFSSLNMLFSYQYSFWIISSLNLWPSVVSFDNSFSFKGIFTGFLISLNWIYFRGFFWF